LRGRECEFLDELDDHGAEHDEQTDIDRRHDPPTGKEKTLHPLLD